jgi:hypothetical protein
MAFRSLALSMGFLMILWGCGEDPGGPPFTGGGGSSGGGGTAGSGAGGSGGTVGTGGSGGGCVFGCGGSGGTAGSGGTGGTAGSGGSGGTGGTAGSGGSGGTAGSGGSGAACETSDLCFSCPSASDASCDCGPAEVCIPSGCETFGGDPIMTCAPAPGGACISNDDCPAEYECISVGFGKSQCVKTTPGCNSTDDCTIGFSCEGGSCVDRRVPCADYTDCPKGHVCKSQPNSQFCARVNQNCDTEDDCSDLPTPWCADIDGDGTTECAGTPNPNDVPPAPACVNTDCGGSTPVCEVSDISSLADCGQYGLCQSDTDCAAGFECVGLWPDGRKECVELGGSCDNISDCPAQQVCASPRLGGPPSCQSGSAAP